MATEIIEYSKVEAALDELRSTYGTVPDPSTDEGYNACKIGAKAVGKYRIELEKKRKEIKAPALERCKMIDSEAKRIHEELAKIEDPLKLAYKKIDEERKERERIRQEKLTQKIEDIKSMPLRAVSMKSDEVSVLIDELEKNDCSEGFYERTPEALKERSIALDSLSNMFKEKVIQEKQAEEAAKQAAELEELRKLKAEQEAKEREEQIKKEAAAQAEREKIAAEERAKQLEKEKAEAEERAKQAEIEAQKRAEEAAEQARQQEIERQKVEEQAEKKRLEKLEANKRHVGKICKEAKICLMKIKGVDEELAKEIVKMIAKGEVDNVSINY